MAYTPPATALACAQAQVQDEDAILLQNYIRDNGLSVTSASFALMQAQITAAVVAAMARWA